MRSRFDVVHETSLKNSPAHRPAQVPASPVRDAHPTI